MINTILLVQYLCVAQYQAGLGIAILEHGGVGGALLNLKKRVASPTGTTEELLGK